jgi:hypothetical protein
MMSGRARGICVAWFWFYNARCPPDTFQFEYVNGCVCIVIYTVLQRRGMQCMGDNFFVRGIARGVTPVQWPHPLPRARHRQILVYPSPTARACPGSFVTWSFLCMARLCARVLSNNNNNTGGQVCLQWARRSKRRRGRERWPSPGDTPLFTTPTVQNT